jgi:hypothetical protein
VIACRKSSKGGPSKTIGRQLASAPPPVGVTSLMVCSNAEARRSTQCVLQYLDGLKDVEADREGIRSSCTA